MKMLIATLMLRYLMLRYYAYFRRALPLFHAAAIISLLAAPRYVYTRVCHFIMLMPLSPLTREPCAALFSLTYILLRCHDAVVFRHADYFDVFIRRCRHAIFYAPAPRSALRCFARYAFYAMILISPCAIRHVAAHCCCRRHVYACRRYTDIFAMPFLMLLRCMRARPCLLFRLLPIFYADAFAMLLILSVYAMPDTRLFFLAPAYERDIVA